MGEAQSKCTMKIQSCVSFIPIQGDCRREQALLWAQFQQEGLQDIKTKGKENQHLPRALYGESMLGALVEATTLSP